MRSRPARARWNCLCELVLASRPGRVRRAVEGKFWQDLVGKAASYVLGDFAWAGFQSTGLASTVIATGGLWAWAMALQVANIYLRDELEPAFREFWTY